MQLDDLRKQIDARGTREDTGVHKVRVRELASQVEAALVARDEEARARARKNIIRTVTGIVAALLSGGGGWIVYERAQPPTAEVGPADVQEAVQSSAEAIGATVEHNAKRVGDVERKVDKLENIAVEQQIQISDGVDFLSRKIDAISAKASRVEEPETITAARRKATKSRARKDLFEAGDK